MQLPASKTTSINVFAASRSFADPLPGSRAAQHGASTHRWESRTCHPFADFILSRPCVAMGYGPNCKCCSTGLQWIRMLNSRQDGMVQSGPNPISKQTSFPNVMSETSTSRVDSIRIWSRARNVSRQTRILPCVHSLPIPNARVVHSVLHRNIPGFFTGLSRDICTGNPQASPLDHPPVFHKFSTGCRPIRPRANSGPWPGATGTPPVGLV
jgi:hypothetical protein